MRGRFYGLVGCLIYQAPNAAARVASAANSPLPNATGGQNGKASAGLRGTSVWLEQQFDQAAARAEASLG
jgi:hypothetical protein